MRVSCGFPGGGSARKRIGECWSTASADGVSQVFVSPILADPVDVLATLAHELVHAFDDCKSGHKGAFTRIARAVGLTGKMTATVAGPELAETLKAIAADLGDYPHKAIKLGAIKVQSTRMRKVLCEVDGYTLRTTTKWLEFGLPTCPCGAEMVDASPTRGWT